MPRKKIVSPAAGSSGLRIRFFRERLGLEQKEVAARVGVTANAVSNWENGRGRPDIYLLPDLCKALDVTLYELFGLEDPFRPFTEAEQRLIGRFRTLSPGHRRALEQLAETLGEVQQTELRPPLRKLICYGRALSAGPGDPTEFEEEGTPIWLYSSRETERADCVFTVNGDSMEPRYRSGDRVLVSRLSDASALPVGEVGAFIAGNETYIKIRGEDGLYSLNPAYAPLRFGDADPVYLIGRVTGVLDPALIVREADAEKEGK